jgi:outer membrane protein OmpA-like peptidoglycan-associated protein
MKIRMPHLLFNWAFLLLIPVFSSFSLFAKESSSQIFYKKTEKILGKVQQAIENNQYNEAEKLVLKAISYDSTNIRSFLFLSDISDELIKPEQKKWALTKVISLDSVNYPKAYKLLASVFFEKGDYLNALNYYNRYYRFMISKDSLFICERINSCRFALASLSQNREVRITHLDLTVNSSCPEYWPSISTDDSLLYFTRLIESDNHYSYERIFISKKSDSGWGESFQMNFSDNEDVNLGTMCLSSDGNLLFFTACGRKDGKGSCDIYFARKINNYWSRPQNAGSIVNSTYWESQPSISSDNRYLFFASNRPGGFGGMDIWCSKVSEMKDGELIFGAPKNLRKGVNSFGNDFSPYIHADGSTLYFSSEGRYGMGGSDLFISKLKDSVWTEAVNLGYPINTRFNEDGLVVSPTSNVAVFSSNREGAIGGSKDLYQIKLPVEFLPERVGYIKGYVYNSETGSKIQTPIEVTQLESKETKTICADKEKGYITTLIAKKTYALNVNTEGFLFYSRHFNLNENNEVRQAERVDIFLDPIKSGKIFVLSNIFFDFDSDKLKEESNTELVQLTDFLQKNPRLSIEISGHTDNVGNRDYNLKLSENRAKAIFDFVKQSVEPTRMIYKGYGSEIPVASNESEQGRAQNRRSEIKVLSIK